MKKIILLTLILISQFSFSQIIEYDNFIYENGKLSWQKIYKSNQIQKDLILNFKKSGIIREFESSENLITGIIEKSEIDYKGFGKSEMSTEMYISRSYLSCFITIELKENRYRITLTDLKLTQRYDDSFTKMGEMSELKDYAVKNNKSDFRSRFKKSSSKILNFTYDKMFNLKNDNSDDW